MLTLSIASLQQFSTVVIGFNQTRIERLDAKRQKAQTSPSRSTLIIIIITNLDQTLNLQRHVNNLRKSSPVLSVVSALCQTTQLCSAAILKNSNGDISATDHTIHSVFGSRVGFSRSADRMALFRVGPNSTGMWEKIMCKE